jgi:oxaloacetate decarboxylase
LPSKNLKGLASSELTGRVTREVDVKARLDEFLGVKR